MKLILADTGTISRKLTLIDEFVIAFDLTGQERIVVSATTKMELYNWINGYKSLLGESKYRKIVTEINLLPVVQMDRKISFLAIELSKRYSFGVPDLLTAATAICYELEIFTINTKHFKDIKGLNLYIPANFE